MSSSSFASKVGRSGDTVLSCAIFLMKKGISSGKALEALKKERCEAYFLPCSYSNLASAIRPKYKQASAFLTKIWVACVWSC